MAEYKLSCYKCKAKNLSSQFFGLCRECYDKAREKDTSHDQLRQEWEDYRKGKKEAK